MAEEDKLVRVITGKPLNCRVEDDNELTATFATGEYDCRVKCKAYELNERKKYKLKEFPQGQAHLNPVNQGTGTVCRTETCVKIGHIGFS